MEERHAEQQIATGFRSEQKEIAGPGLIDLIGMGMADQFRRARGAPGVEIGRDIVAGNRPAADEAIVRLRLYEFAKGINSLRSVARPTNLHDRLEVFQLPAHLFDLLPDVR